MKYYQPVGIGGSLFHVASAMNGLMGRLVYWRASRRRVLTILSAPAPVGHPGSTMGRPEIWNAVATGLEPRSLADSGFAVIPIEP